MKTILTALFLSIISITFSQVGGKIANDKRPITQPINFEVTGTKPGEIYFTISVNEAGDVISCKVIKSKTTVFSTPTTVKARNLITSKLKFEADSSYPQFHIGYVLITVIKP